VTIRKKILLRVADDPFKLPANIRTSNLATWFYCAERCRHIIMKMVASDEANEYTETGTIFHKILEESMGRRFPWEIRVWEYLKKKEDKKLGLTRKIIVDDIEVTLSGHVDDIQVTRDFAVSVIENKTIDAQYNKKTGKPNLWFVERFKLPIAKFQSQIYSIILEPYIHDFGGCMNNVNAIQYWDRGTFRFVKDYQAIFNALETRSIIENSVRAFYNPEKIIPPKTWKCKKCPEKHKEVCQFWLQNHKSED